MQKLNVEHVMIIWNMVERDIRDGYANLKEERIDMDADAVRAQSSTEQPEQTLVNYLYGDLANLPGSLPTIFDAQKLISTFFQTRVDVPRTGAAKILFQETAMFIAKLALASSIGENLKELNDNKSALQKCGAYFLDNLTNEFSEKFFSQATSDVQIFLLQKINTLLQGGFLHNDENTTQKIIEKIQKVFLQHTVNKIEFSKVNKDINKKLSNLMDVVLKFTQNLQQATTARKNLITASRKWFDQHPKNEYTQREDILYAIIDQWSRMQESLSLEDLQWLQTTADHMQPTRVQRMGNFLTRAGEAEMTREMSIGFGMFAALFLIRFLILGLIAKSEQWCEQNATETSTHTKQRQENNQFTCNYLVPMVKPIIREVDILGAYMFLALIGMVVYSTCRHAATLPHSSAPSFPTWAKELQTKLQSPPVAALVQLPGTSSSSSDRSNNTNEVEPSVAVPTNF